MKKLLILVLLALPVVWWVKDPQAARQKTVQVLRTIEAKFGQWADRLDPLPVDEAAEAAAQASPLPENVYLLRQEVVAKFHPVPGKIIKGSQVRVIGSAEGRKIITDGTREAIVADELLTRNPAEIEDLLQAARDGHEAQLSQRRAELEARLSAIENKLTSVKAELEAVRARDAKAREGGRKQAQYGTQEQFLLTEINRQEGFRASVLKEIQALR